MDDFDEDKTFSAIYESVDSDLEMDEYVTVNHPALKPYPYQRPEPKVPAPSLPPLSSSSSSWAAEEKLLPHRSQQHFISSSNEGSLVGYQQGRANPSREASLLGYRQAGLNPLPLPRKEQGRPPQEYFPAQKSLKYGKPGELPHKPPRPPTRPKPGDASKEEGLAPEATPMTMPHYHEQQLATNWGQEFNRARPQQGIYGNDTEQEAQYDSIKETRKMIALKKRHQQQQIREKEDETNEEGKQTLSPSSSREDLVAEGMKTGGGNSTVTCILLSITIASLLIAIASLAMSLYCITTLSKSHNTDSKSPTEPGTAVASIQCHTSALNGSEEANSMNCAMMLSDRTQSMAAPSLQAPPDSQCSCSCGGAGSANSTNADNLFQMECHMTIGTC